MRPLSRGNAALAAVFALALLAFPTSALAGTITVTSTKDTGAGTLRAAIEHANPGETIDLPAGEYELSSALPRIEKSLTFVGMGARHTIINAEHENLDVFYIEAGNVNIEQLAIEHARPTGGSGGGVALYGGAARLDGVTVNDDSASTNVDGGGIYSGLHTSLTIESSTISNNVGYNGAGLYLDGTTTIENSTISANIAGNSGDPGDGGALQNNGALMLLNDTIADNEGGGGAGVWGGGVTAKNTIVADNRTFSAATDNCEEPFAATGPNLENGSECEFAKHGGIGKTEPKLGALANNGGETETMALLTGSPAIDAGTNEGCPATDQRGVKRPQGASCDIGAYEFQTIADMGVTQSVSPSAVIGGGEAVFTLKVTDNGPEAASGVEAQDALPPASTLISAVPSQGSCSGSAPVKCALGSLALGASATVTVTVRLNQLGTNTNTASVSSEASDDNAANNQSQLAVAVFVGKALPPLSPVIEGLSQTHSTWIEKKTHGAAKHAHLGTRFTFNSSEAASVTFTFIQHLPGRKVKGRCVAQTSKNKHAHSCKRTVARGTLAFSAKAGANELSFTGSVPHGKLKPGIYTVRVTAVSSTGERSTPQQLTFTIL